MRVRRGTETRRKRDVEPEKKPSRKERKAAEKAATFERVQEKFADVLGTVEQEGGLREDALPHFADELAALKGGERKALRELLIEHKADTSGQPKVRKNGARALVKLAAGTGVPTTSKEAHALAETCTHALAELRRLRKQGVEGLDDEIARLGAYVEQLAHLEVHLEELEWKTNPRNAGFAVEVGAGMNLGLGGFNVSGGVKVSPRDRETKERTVQGFVAGKATLGPKGLGGVIGQGGIHGKESSLGVGPVGMSEHPVYGKEKSLNVPVLGGFAVNEEDGARLHVNLPLPLVPLPFPIAKSSVSVQITEPSVAPASEVVVKVGAKLDEKLAPIQERVDHAKHAAAQKLTRKKPVE